MENQTQNIAAPTAAPMIDANPMVAAPRRRQDAGFSGRLMTMPAAGATAHAMGQVSFANANVVFIKAWAPPPRRVSL